MQEEVTIASETSDAFSDETLKEHAVFQFAKQAEMKEMLSNVADGQIEMYREVRRPWARHFYGHALELSLHSPYRFVRQCVNGIK